MRRSAVMRVVELVAPTAEESPRELMVRAVEMAVTEGLTPREIVALIDEIEQATGLELHPRTK